MSGSSPESRGSDGSGGRGGGRAFSIARLIGETSAKEGTRPAAPGDRGLSLSAPAKEGTRPAAPGPGPGDRGLSWSEHTGTTFLSDPWSNHSMNLNVDASLHSWRSHSKDSPPGGALAGSLHSVPGREDVDPDRSGRPDRRSEGQSGGLSKVSQHSRNFPVAAWGIPVDAPRRSRSVPAWGRRNSDPTFDRYSPRSGPTDAPRTGARRQPPSMPTDEGTSMDLSQHSAPSTGNVPIKKRARLTETEKVNSGPSPDGDAERQKADRDAERQKVDRDADAILSLLRLGEGSARTGRRALGPGVAGDPGAGGQRDMSREEALQLRRLADSICRTGRSRLRLMAMRQRSPSAGAGAQRGAEGDQNP